MRLTLTVAVLCCTAMLCTGVKAETGEFTGNDLLPYCRDFINKQFHKDPIRQGQCISVIQALAFAAPLFRPFYETSKSCPPDGATVGQLTTVVVRWMEQHPQDWHKHFFALVLFALHDT